MKTRLLFLIVALLAVAGGILVMQKRQKPATRSDPAFYHTPAGVNAVIQEQRIVLTEALKNKDLPFIHGQMYYLQGLADALSEKLAGEQKQRVDPRLAELKVIAEEIDNFSGRGNLEATQSGLSKLFATLDAVNAEFPSEKK